MDLFGSPAFDDHEQVVFCADRGSGLRAIIGVHDLTLGPAAGGCRMWPYAREDDAVFDVLRLSRGMTYKAAMAGLPWGGGKAVVIGDPRSGKTEALYYVSRGDGSSQVSRTLDEHNRAVSRYQLRRPTK